MAENEESIGGYGQRISDAATIDLTKFSQAFAEMGTRAIELNKLFGQNNQRMVELMEATSNAVPAVNRLGGSMADVSKTMQGIAEGARRNVVANTEDVAKLYAATQVLGKSASQLTDSFASVGIGFEQIGKNVEDSISYIQSIGGNAAQVMGKVLDYTSQLNRFQFEGGVQGLTKMAAQATMLRFDMKQTFDLANKVLDPEAAVSVASAFQRLGVAAGNLVDPFQLMNQSINDPQGLQQSLVDVGKQFTYFDEKTKTFKINPQGVLTLRELEKQTGVSAAELTKAGLAAAELDKRVSSIRPEIKFKNEEDKQYLSNIAKMGDKGKYEVTLEDGTKKELGQLNQEEFDKLIKEQKDGPKTLEDIQRSQLQLDKLVAGDIEAIKNKILYGIVSSRPLTTTVAAARRIEESSLGVASEPQRMSVEGVRKESNIFTSNIADLVRGISEGKGTKESLISFIESNKNQYDRLSKDFKQGVGELLQDMSNKSSTKTAAERFLKNKYSAGAEALGTKSSFLEGKEGALERKSSGTGAGATTTTNSTVDVGGTIKVEFVTPNGSELTKKMFDDWANSPNTKQFFASLVAPKNPTKAPVNTNYGN